MKEAQDDQLSVLLDAVTILRESYAPASQRAHALKV